MKKKTVEEIKEKIWEEKERWSDNLDRTFDYLLWKLCAYWYIKRKDCDFLPDYECKEFDEED